MIDSDMPLSLDVERVKYLNRRVLQNLELDGYTVAGEIRTHSVGVAMYKGAPLGRMRLFAYSFVRLDQRYGL